MRAGLSDLLFGADPRLRRMMQYWSATVLLYLIFLALLGRCADLGIADRDAVRALDIYTLSAIALFYVAVRASRRLHLAPNLLAALQGVFGISCTIWAYSLTGPLRHAMLMGLMVVLVFCTWALRPRQVLLLAFGGLAGIGATMWWHQAHDPLHYPPFIEGITFCVMTGCSLTVTFLTGEMSKLRTRLKAQKEELVQALDTIRTLATLDELTALANRRHMNEVLALEERRDDTSGQATCIALLDIDFFKQINDHHGHAAGDEVLRQFAASARAELRACDVLARWGGEEFLLMLPDTAPEDALALLARLRARVAQLALAGTSFERPLSFSGGLTTRQGREPLATTVNRADKALYQAKSSGRDRVVVAS